MMLDTSDRTLFALFCLSRDTGFIDAAALGQATGQTPTQAAESLLRLERAGWVDASRARLTMLGLARAAQLAARFGRGSGGHGVSLHGARIARRPVMARPIAARPVAAQPAAARPAAAQLTAAVAGRFPHSEAMPARAASGPCSPRKVQPDSAAEQAALRIKPPVAARAGRASTQDETQASTRGQDRGQERPVQQVAGAGIRE